MHDFKIRTDLALFSMLNVKQFSFESLNGEKKEKNQELFQQAAMHIMEFIIEQESLIQLMEKIQGLLKKTAYQ